MLAMFVQHAQFWFKNLYISICRVVTFVFLEMYVMKIRCWLQPIRQPWPIRY